MVKKFSIFILTVCFMVGLGVGNLFAREVNERSPMGPVVNGRNFGTTPSNSVSKEERARLIEKFRNNTTTDPKSDPTKDPEVAENGEPDKDGKIRFGKIIDEENGKRPEGTKVDKTNDVKRVETGYSGPRKPRPSSNIKK